MTSASELYYTRRSRLDRSAPDLEPDIQLYWRYHHRRHRRDHNRYDSDACGPFRRISHARHLSQHWRTAAMGEQGGEEFLSSNNGVADLPGSTNTRSFNLNERLPGAVVLARARLMERLRGVNLSGDRQSIRSSSEIRRRERRLLREWDWETDSSSVRFGHEDSNIKRNSLQSREEIDLSCAQEVYSCREIDTRAKDCSICLESFTEGDVLTSLQCRHRFHSSCLHPWVRMHGNCPYCRRTYGVRA